MKRRKRKNKHQFLKSFELEINNLKKCYYLWDYLPKNNFNQNGISKCILDFKDNNNIQVQSLSKIASEACQSVFSNNIDIVIRALGHDEVLVQETNRPLDSLGRQISTAINAEYHPNFLNKTEKNSSLKFLSKENRVNELHGKYIFKSPLDKLNLSVLLIDDITTTGSTIKEICRAINVQLPGSNIYFFALGKTKSKTTFIPENKISEVQLNNLREIFSNPDNEIISPKKKKRNLEAGIKNAYSK